MKSLQVSLVYMVWTMIDLALLKFTNFYNWKMDDRIIYVNWGEEIFMYVIYFPPSCKHTLLHPISPPHPSSSQTPVIFQGLSSGHDTRQLCDFNKKMLPGFTKRQRIPNTDWNAPLWSHFAVIFTTGKKKNPLHPVDAVSIPFSQLPDVSGNGMCLSRCTGITYVSSGRHLLVLAW